MSTQLAPFLHTICIGLLILIATSTVKHFGWHDGLAIVGAILLLMPQVKVED